MLGRVGMAIEGMGILREGRVMSKETDIPSPRSGKAGGDGNFGSLILGSDGIAIEGIGILREGRVISKETSIPSPRSGKAGGDGSLGILMLGNEGIAIEGIGILRLGKLILNSQLLMILEQCLCLLLLRLSVLPHELQL